jgi:hypothetical protein
MPETYIVIFQQYTLEMKIYMSNNYSIIWVIITQR